MQIEGSVALVTGARRGMGREFVHQLRQRSARRVYAAVRDASAQEIPGAELISLDVTDPDAAARAATLASDVSLVINNAGISTMQRLVDGDLAEIRRELDTHFYGTLNVVRAFAPVLAGTGHGKGTGGDTGGGAILNMLSALSWISYDGAGAYAAAKAAAWSLTDAIRLELAPQRTLVTGLFVGAVDTEMMDGIDVPKVDPAAVVRAGLDGIEAGALQVIADEATAVVRASLAEDPAVRYPALTAGTR